MKSFYNKSIILITALILLCMVATHARSAEPAGKITGTVLDDKATTMPYATVDLLKAQDSLLVKRIVTNENGVYFFEHVKQGTYIIRVSVIGFAKTSSKPVSLNGDAAEITVPAIKLGNSTKTLKEINITGTKPLIERKTDRTVMNVENSVLAAGNSAMEILERAPGVSIDKDDNISLKGKQGVTVMINDKLTYLSAAQLATLLRSTDGTTIQSIEIITNPSAKYDASGNSGIINIKLKKTSKAAPTAA